MTRKPTSQVKVSSQPTNWTAEQVQELYDKARGMYLSLTGLTETPREAAEIICMMHLLLYLNYGDVDGDVDKMLGQYTQNFREAFDNHMAEAKKAQQGMN